MNDRNSIPGHEIKILGDSVLGPVTYFWICSCGSKGRKWQEQYGKALLLGQSHLQRELRKLVYKPNRKEKLFFWGATVHYLIFKDEVGHFRCISKDRFWYEL